MRKTAQKWSIGHNFTHLLSVHFPVSLCQTWRFKCFACINLHVCHPHLVNHPTFRWKHLNGDMETTKQTNFISQKKKNCTRKIVNSFEFLWSRKSIWPQVGKINCWFDVVAALNSCTQVGFVDGKKFLQVFCCSLCALFHIFDKGLPPRNRNRTPEYLQIVESLSHADLRNAFPAISMHL